MFDIQYFWLISGSYRLLILCLPLVEYFGALFCLLRLYIVIGEYGVALQLSFAGKLQMVTV